MSSVNHRCAGAMSRFSSTHLGYDIPRRAHGVAAAKGRFGAPVAGVGTTARRGDVPGQRAVPRAAIVSCLDEVPRRERQEVKVPLCAIGTRRAAIRQDQPGDPFEIGFAAAPEIGETEHRSLAFTLDHGLRSGFEVGHRVIARVGTVDDNMAIASGREADHGQRAFAANRGAHLGEEVEIVIHDRDHARLGPVEVSLERLDSFGEGIEAFERDSTGPSRAWSRSWRTISTS